MSVQFHALVRAQEEGDYVCLECSEPIYNPICPECISKAFKKWVKKYPKYEQRVIPLLNKYLKSHKNFEDISQICVVCGKDSTYVCPYCFGSLIYELLKEVKVPKKILKEYMIFFHFDFGDFKKQRWGHYKEGEDLGVF